MKTAILTILRMVLAAFSLAGLAYAQDVAMAPQVGPIAGAARPVPNITPASEPADLSGMLAAHNQARTRLGLKPLSWSAELADAARATARKASQGACSMASTTRFGRDLNVSLHWASAVRRFGGADAVQDISAGYVVTRWREGSAAYEAAGGKCPPGSSQCMAYARIAAPDNREIGCARLVCPSQAQIWTCHYRT